MGTENKSWFEGLPFDTPDSPGGQMYFIDGLPVDQIESVTLDTAITGSTGIASGEAFGSGGTVAFQYIIGVTGIASGEAFGSGGATGLNIAGVSGIASGEAFGSGGVVAGPLVGVSGIASGEAFGSGGTISSNTVTGTAGIPSAEAFGADGAVGSVGGPIVGVTGIASAEAFGSGGIVAGPIYGDTGIPSAEAFGSGGNVYTLISGTAGIPSGEAFGSGGSIYWGLWGAVGIESEEAFGNSGAVLSLDTANSNFAVFINGVNISPYLRENSISVNRQLNFQASASFAAADESGSWEPVIGQPVVIYFFDEDMTEAEHGFYKPGSDGWVRIFAGTIDSIDWGRYHLQEPTRDFSVQCSDYGKSLSRRLLTMKYTGDDYGTLTSILEDLQERIFTPEGITWVNRGDPGTVLGDLDFSYTPLNEVLDRLAEATGWDWQFDFYRNLYFYDRPATTTSAPFDITEATSGVNGQLWTDLRVHRDRGLYRNRQNVKASIAPEAARLTRDFIVPINTVTPYNIFWNGFLFSAWEWNNKLSRIEEVRVNGTPVVLWRPGEAAPSGWEFHQTDPTVLDFYRNSPTFDQYPIGTVLSVDFTLTTDFPEPVLSENSAEIAARQAIEGGTGIYEALETLTDISDAAMVQEYADNLLTRFGVMGLELDFSTHRYGLEPGMSTVVNLPGMDINETLIVESITLQEEAKRVLRQTVKLSNQIQQRDALTAMHRLIKRIRKSARAQEVNIPFDIAKTLPGITNPGAEVGVWGNPFIVPYDNFTLKDFSLYFATPPSGGFFEMRILRNGTNIFNTNPQYTDGITAILTFNDFAVPVLVKDDILTMEILYVGSIQPGKNGIGVLRGYI
jgi:hypothetical protein